jgi:hypothetical protein
MTFSFNHVQKSKRASPIGPDVPSLTMTLSGLLANLAMAQTPVGPAITATRVLTRLGLWLAGTRLDTASVGEQGADHPHVTTAIASNMEASTLVFSLSKS